MNESAVSDEARDLLLEEAAGPWIDTLDALLTAYDPRGVESQQALRRQARHMADEARRRGWPMVAIAAEKAAGSSGASLRTLGAVLLAILRGCALPHRRLEAPADGEHDAPTGLLNRDGFTRRYEDLTTIEHIPVAMAAIHVDNYEPMLHTRGPEAARLLLQHVADVLVRHLRESDCLAHFEGDEFMLLLPGEDEAGLDTALHRLETTLMSRPFRLAEGHITESIRVSAGGFQIVGGASPLSRGKHSIGLALRNPTLAQTLTQVLQREGFMTVDAGGPADQPYRRFGHHGVGLVLLEAGRADLLRELPRLRAVLRNERIPVVVLAPSDEVARWALDHGASDVLTLPLDLGQLVRLARLLINRGRGSPVAAGLTTDVSRSVLVASEDLYQLIALGSALQRRGGYEVLLGRGGADALRQVQATAPVSALIDLRMHRRETRELLETFARRRPGQGVVLVVERGEAAPAPTSSLPPLARVLEKPVSLLDVADEFRKATGLAPLDGGETADQFRRELLRVMRGDWGGSIA